MLPRGVRRHVSCRLNGHVGVQLINRLDVAVLAEVASNRTLDPAVGRKALILGGELLVRDQVIDILPALKRPGLRG